jgi:LysM repeat protein
MHVSPAGGAPLKAAAALFLTTALALLVQACDLVGGGSNDLTAGGQSVSRPGSVPTATPPATLPEPILLGAAPDPIGGGSNPGGTTGSNPALGGGTYTVKPGETLAAIAASQGVAGPDQAAWIAEVLRLNNIADARLLAAGQELTLPRQAPAAGATPRPGTTPAAGATPTRPTGTPGAGTSPTATPRPGTTPSPGGNTYTVQSGDNPGSIASKLGVPAAQQQAWITQLLQMNNTTAATLQIGQVLQLPAVPR